MYFSYSKEKEELMSCRQNRPQYAAAVWKTEEDNAADFSARWLPNSQA
jgi:hypothetical protein